MNGYIPLGEVLILNLSDFLFYQDDWATIYCGDCLEVMPLMGEKIDMILCDLPYGRTACKWDTVIPLEPLWKEYKRLIKDNGVIVLTASQPFTSILITSNLNWFKYEWIWEKDQCGNFMMAKKRPMKVHENVVVFCSGQSFYNPLMEKRDEMRIKKTVSNKMRQINNLEITGGTRTIRSLNYDVNFRYPRSVQYFNTPSHETGEKVHHPTQKPMVLFEYLIKTYTNAGDMILDNCLGSGTTLVASKRLNRKAIGIEIIPKYCEMAVKRLKQEVFSFGVK